MTRRLLPLLPLLLATVARAEVKRRDHLILLGLARRAAAKTKAPPAP